MVGWSIFLLPIIAAAVSLILPEKIKAPFASIISLVVLLLSLLLLAGPNYEETFTWLPHLKFGLFVDQLSKFMSVAVSFVSFCVVVYSAESMKHEDITRYYPLILLFIGGMLGLILSDNFLQVYIFWELIGICSFLLIAFWYKRKSAVNAGVKALLVTRVGDVGLLIGIILLFMYTGSLTFTDVAKNIGLVNAETLKIISLLFLIGAIGKSAQMPLHFWLPDAMEGPTTVSALIHAATMVKAGVYLVARILPLFGGITIFTNVLIFVGTISALWAGLKALIEKDIKRILAYSTISQIGFMFVVLGYQNMVAVSFHLLNHALFKGLLFLAAGIIIHSLKTRNIIELGGLWKRMPFTFVLFSIGALSLAAFPPLGGFWSKDMMLASIKQAPVFFAAVLVSLITAMYAFRMVFWIFLRKPARKVAKHRVHEPAIMVLVCGFLATACILSGLINGTFASFMGGIAQYSHQLIEYSTFITLLGFAIVVYHSMYHKKIEQIGVASLLHDALKIDIIEHAYHKLMHVGAIVFLETEYEEVEHIATDLLKAVFTKIKVQVPKIGDWLWDTFEINLIERSDKIVVDAFTKIHKSTKKIFSGSININVLLVLIGLLLLVMFS